MSVLSMTEIRDEMNAGRIIVRGSPSGRLRIGPSSVDIHLGPKLKVYRESSGHVLDPMDLPGLDDHPLVEGRWLLKPGTLYLGSSMEWTETRGLVPDCNGRSSIGRLGVSIHATAGWGDAGFRGNWTLEISCVQAVYLYPQMRIGQLRYHRTGPGAPYEGRYQGAVGVVPSRYRDRE